MRDTDHKAPRFVVVSVRTTNWYQSREKLIVFMPGLFYIVPVLCDECVFLFITKFLLNEWKFYAFNPLNTKFNPICHLLALLGAHHILHISRIRVKI